MMRLLAIVPLAAALIGHALAAEEKAPAEPKTPAEFTAAFAALQKDLAAKVAGVEAAIARASRAGQLSVGTEAYYLSLLEPARLQMPDALPVLPQIPPRFDASPEMEPVNTAWAELEGEETRQIAARRVLSEAAEAECAGKLEEALRTATKPEELKPLHEWMQCLTNLAPPPRTGSRAADAAWDEVSPDDTAAVLIPAEEALAALQTKDTPRLARALNLLPNPHVPGALGRFSPTRGVPSPRTSAMAEELKQRCLRAMVADVKAAQTVMEHALLQKKPRPELDADAAGVLHAIGGLQQVEEAARTINPYTPPPAATRGGGNSTRNLPLTAPRKAAFDHYLVAIARLEGEPAPAPRKYPPSSPRGGGSPEAPPEYALGVEFEKFWLTLPPPFREKEPAAEPDPAQYAAAKEAAARKIISRVEEALARIGTPEEALKFADRLAANQTKLPPEAFDEAPLRGYPAIPRALRALALQWQQGTLNLGFSEFGPVPVSTAFAALESRAWHDEAARRLALPELRQSPYAEMPLADALRHFATESADRRDWKRALIINQAAAALDPGSSAIGKSIHAYLVARQFEDAQLYREAARSYESVLRNVVEHTPIAESTERLKALRAEHPEAFPQPDEARRAGGK